MIVMSIAGVDPSGGAGVYADLKTFQAIGVYGCGIVTALTAQNPYKFFSTLPVSEEYIAEQIDAVMDSYEIEFVKTGMLYSPEIIKLVSKKIREYNLKAVVDPVMVATSGGDLTKEDIAKAMNKYLHPQAILTTPNVSEAENIAAAERYLTSVGLIDFKDSYPHELSGGMKQRVAIIRSLLNHSPILLMDEPFSAVDMQNRHSLQEQLIGVWKRFENTIVFVTHDVDEAVYLADKIVILDKNPGRIAKIVEVDIERPRKRESPEFIALQESIVQQLNMED